MYSTVLVSESGISYSLSVTNRSTSVEVMRVVQSYISLAVRKEAKINSIQVC